MNSANKRSKPMPLLEDIEHSVDTAINKPIDLQNIEKPFYRIEKVGTYDWLLIEKVGDKETILKKDTQDICWAFMKRALIQGFR